MRYKNKILFIHNSITWYRIPLFEELNKICNIRYLFTKVEKSNEIYRGIQYNNNFSDNIDYKITENFLGLSIESIHEVIKGEYDVVLITVLDTWDQIIEAFLCAIIAKLRRKKVVYFWERWDAPKNVLSMSKKFKFSFRKGLLRLLSNFVDTYIASGTKSKNYFESAGIEKSKIIVAFDSSQITEKNEKINIREKYGIEKNKKIILYFGRIVEYKGLDILIRAFSRLDKLDNSFLMICGDGDFKKECYELSQELNIKNIAFTGMIKSNDRNSYFEESDIFVLPNKFVNGAVEAWGLTINEAMEFGKPVISTNANGGAVDLIINKENGYVINQNDINELTSALYNIISDDELRIKMGNKSKELIKQKFNYKEMAKSFKEAFEF